MSDVGITGYGAYIPERRLKRDVIFAANAWAHPGLKGQAKGRRAVANWDEDPITMAVEAARDCLRDCLGDRAGGIDRLLLASTSFPFADRQNSALVADALMLPERVATLDAGGALKAATSALRTLLESGGTSLLLAADRRVTKPASHQEMVYGDGAAALRIGGDRVIARFLGADSISRDLVDHYRESDADFDYALEDRWVREEGYQKIVPAVVGPLMARLGLGGGDIAHFILPCGVARLPEAIAGKLGIAETAVADNLGAACGQTGAAHPILMLAAVLERARAGEKILLVGFGQGADALLFEVTDAITAFRPRLGVAAQLAAAKDETSYVRFLSHQGLLAMDWGPRAERDNRTALSTFYRKRDIVSGFVGGKCSRCGTAQFPRTAICVNPNCNAEGTQEPYGFAGVPGQIKSFTEDWQAFTPDPPLKYGNVTFAGGGNVMMELADFDVGEARVGTPLRMVFRIKDFDDRRQFRRYFWKAAPVRGTAAQESTPEKAAE